MLLVQALMHAVPAVVTGALVLLLALLRAHPDQRRRTLYRVALLGAPAACVALVLVAAGFDSLARDANGAARVWSPAHTPFWAIAGCFTGGPGWRSWFLPLIALSAPLAIWRLRRTGPVHSADVALLLGGGALLAFALAAPLHLPAWDYFSVRFLPAAVCCLVLVWPIERLRTRAQRGLAAGLLAGRSRPVAGPSPTTAHSRLARRMPWPGSKRTSYATVRACPSYSTPTSADLSTNAARPCPTSYRSPTWVSSTPPRRAATRRTALR
jgi:hypothetical protein